jgi:hypothetical protein
VIAGVLSDANLDWKEGRKKLPSANVKDHSATDKSAVVSPDTQMLGDKLDDLTQMIARASGDAVHAHPDRRHHTFRCQRGKRKHDVDVRTDQGTQTMGDVVDSAGNEYKVFSVLRNHNEGIESKTEACYSIRDPIQRCSFPCQKC